MASKSIGSLYAELTLRDGKFTQKLKNARKSLSEFGSSTMKYAGVALGAAATGIGAGLTAGTLNTLKQVAALDDLSNQTGITISDLTLLRRAYEDGGAEADAAGKDINKMQKTLAEASTGGANPFESLGLSVESLMAQNPAEQFRQIGAAIMKIENPALRTSKAMDIFGKGGAKLLGVFPGINDSARVLGKMPEIAQQFGKAMAQADDYIGRLPLKSDQFFVGFTAGIIDKVLPNLKKIDDYDFTQLGQNLGQSLTSAFEQVTSSTMWEIWGLKGTLAIAKLAKKGGAIFGEIGNTIQDILIQLGGSQEVRDAWNAQQAQRWQLNPQTGQYDLQQSSMQDEAIAKMEEALAGLTKYQSQIEKRRAAMQAADSAFAGLFDQPKSPPLTDAFSSPDTSPAAAKSPDRIQFQSPFTDYQRRGLSSGISPVNESKVQKQIDLLQGIRDILKQATLDGATLKF